MGLPMKKLKQLKDKQFIVNDLNSLQKEFYKTYDPDYWLYKIGFLKNCHDNFDGIKKTLSDKLNEIVDEDYKKMIRTEMHFLYFQMVETLFEIIFAISKHDGRNLWLALTISNWKENYKQVADLSEMSH